MDYGHEQADKMLKDLEKRIHKEYQKAAREVEASMNKWLAQYKKNDDQMRELWKSGEITRKEYTDWRKKQIILSDKWKAQRDELTQRYMEADKVASGLINDHKMEVYALNYNYGTYEVEKGARLDTGFSLYNKDSVARLMRDNPKLLPPPGKRTSERIRKGELKKWNRRQVQSVMTQGILQGESIQKISKRLAVTVSEKNAYSHYRAARTMTTSAENAGRLASYQRAEDMGIKMGKTWLAAHDNHTRASHREYDGMTIPLKEEFATNLMFPGDPDGDPAEVYNCRCSLVADVLSVDGIDLSDIGARPWEDEWDIDYNEWKTAHTKASNAKRLDRSKIQYSVSGQNLKTRLDRNGVEYKEVTVHAKQPSEAKIIDRLAGGDETKGSCFSLACAYAGNKNGLDVLDFRGGRSQEVFAGGFRNIARLDGIAVRLEAKGGINPAKKLLKSMEDGKEYILTTGRHAAVVRLNDGKPQYLELQSATMSGWHGFEEDVVWYKGTPYETKKHYTASDTLRERFGCKGTTISESSLIDIDSFKDSKEFRDLLGYINTDPGKQKKGARGHAK